jgi:hypothetical protein
MRNVINRNSLTYQAAAVATFSPTGQKRLVGLRMDTANALAWRRYR